MPPKKGKRDNKASIPAGLMKQTAMPDFLDTKDKLGVESDKFDNKGVFNRETEGGRKKINSMPEDMDPRPCKRSKSSSDTAQPSSHNPSISFSTPKTRMSTSMESLEIETPKGMRDTNTSSEISRTALNVYHGFTEDDQALLDGGELTEKDLQVDFSDDELNMEITEDERKRMTEQELKEYETQIEQMEFANQLLTLDTMQLIKESDMLNIKFDREEFNNLCRLSEIGLVSHESEYDRLGSVQLSELDMIFITDPEFRWRHFLVYSFSSKYSSENRCVVDHDDLVSLLHFIAQAPSKELILPQSHKRMFKASENLLRSLKQVNHENMERHNYENLKKRQELCRINLELFCCSIIPCIDFSTWRTRFVTSILRNFCQVYLDIVAVRLKAKLSTAFEIIVDSLDDDKKERVLNEFCVKLTKWNLEQTSFLSGMRSVLTMLSRFPFFDAYRMRTAYYVFKAVLPENAVAVKESEHTNGVDSYDKQKITVMHAFNLVPKVVELLANKPTDLYLTMQLLNICTMDSMLKEQSLKTLMNLQDRMNVAKLHMKTTIRLDDRIIESLCDAPHRIQMVINSKRQAIVYNPYFGSTTSSDESDE